MPVHDDILFVAMEDWDEVWRRNQPIAAGFAERSPGRKLLYMGLPIDVSHGLRRLSFGPLLRALRPARTPASPAGFGNIFLFNPVKWLPNSLPFCQHINRWMERRQLRRAARRVGLRHPILWLNPHYGLHLVGSVGESLVVYDIGDDWSQIKQAEWVRRQTIAEDAELCRRADVLIVVSKHLQRLKSELARRVELIPNGVYVERYAGIADGSLPPHPATQSWRHPVLAYTGTLHEERVDLALVEKIAEAFPAATVALIGPCLLDEKARRRLTAHPNIRMPGAFPFEEIPRVMSAFDVCIVPHVVSGFTESLSPLKLYEYLAAGLPTVSTLIPGFRDHPQWIHLAADADAFITALQKALQEPRRLRAPRQAAARAHSWAARMDAIELAIENGKANASPCQRHRSSPSSSSATTLATSRSDA